MAGSEDVLVTEAPARLTQRGAVLADQAVAAKATVPQSKLLVF
jgi:hypothetical protein